MHRGPVEVVRPCLGAIAKVHNDGSWFRWNVDPASVVRQCLKPTRVVLKQKGERAGISVMPKGNFTESSESVSLGVRNWIANGVEIEAHCASLARTRESTA